MTAHRDIQAHLSAGERTPARRAQHLLSATELAKANGVPDFGRWNEQQINRRTAKQRANHGIQINQRGEPEAQRGETGSGDARRLPAPSGKA